MKTVPEEKKKPAAPSPKKPDPKSEEGAKEKEYKQAEQIFGWSRWAVGYQNRAQMCRQAAEKFQSLDSYKDSPARAEECLAAAERAESEERDADFRKIMEEADHAKTPDDYLYAAEALNRMPDHPEAEAAERMCVDQYRRLRKRAGRLRVAVALLLCLVLALGAVLVRTQTLQYGLGTVCVALKRYDSAIKWYRQAPNYEDSVDRITECSYLRAAELFDEGWYATAYKTYRAIGDYRGAEAWAEESFRRMLARQKPGSVVEFGQDESGKLVKWYVLDNNGDTVTLIAEFDEARAFDSSGEQRTWADSELRLWLNTEFLSQTFLRYERDRLAQPVLHSDGGIYGLDGGADTADQVYILSAEEAQAYAEVLGAVGDNGKAKDKYSATAYGWWLRTPGAADCGAAVVNQDGSIDYYGHDQASDQTRVRPVIQVSIQP